MSDPNVIFGGLGAAAIIASGFSSYFGMKYGLNGLRDRIVRIEEHTKAIPELQREVAVLKALKEQRHSSGERDSI